LDRGLIQKKKLLRKPIADLSGRLLQHFAQNVAYQLHPLGKFDREFLHIIVANAGANEDRMCIRQKFRKEQEIVKLLAEFVRLGNIDYGLDFKSIAELLFNRFFDSGKQLFDA